MKEKKYFDEITINNKTSLYCIIGMPAHHSLSPAIHNAGFKKLKINSVFLAFDVPQNALEDAIAGMRAFGIKGMTLTSPHKENAYKYIDEIDIEAKQIGAVNTIINKDGRLFGYNTDGIGFIKSLRKYRIRKDAVYTIIGAGGAARAFSFSLAKEGVTNLNIINRTVAHAESLKSSLNKYYKNTKINIYELDSKDSYEIIKNSDFIINATNITLENNTDTPIKKELIKEDMVIFDANYAPLENRLIKDAKNAGAKTINGLELLINQGIAAFKLFTGRDIDYKTMEEAALLALKIRKNKNKK